MDTGLILAVDLGKFKFPCSQPLLSIRLRLAPLLPPPLSALALARRSPEPAATGGAVRAAHSLHPGAQEKARHHR